jgi:hypothetical protein
MSTEQASTNDQHSALPGVRLQPVDDLTGTADDSDGNDSAGPGKAGALSTQPGGTGSDAEERVIWTPAFLLLFGFALVAGLSLESLLTQGWLNGMYTGLWVFQAHVTLVGMGWLALLVLARSRWVRVGALFGLAWAVFMTIDMLVQAALGVGPLNILAHVNVLICLSLLGCSMCLSIDRFLLRPWDAWVLGLLPAGGVVATVLLFLLAPDHSLFALEGMIASVSLALSGVVWLVRPSCWRVAPGLIVLFGLVPVILFGLDVANGGYTAVNFFLTGVVLGPDKSVSMRETSFFFSQVALLCLLLGTLRLLKSEVSHVHLR